MWESNPRLLRPKLRIIPLDQIPIVPFRVARRRTNLLISLSPLAFCRRKSKKPEVRTGDRTQNLQIRSLTPYPLGYADKYPLWDLNPQPCARDGKICVLPSPPLEEKLFREHIPLRRRTRYPIALKGLLGISALRDALSPSPSQTRKRLPNKSKIERQL